MSYMLFILSFALLPYFVLCLPYYQSFKAENGEVRLVGTQIEIQGEAGGHRYVSVIGGKVQYYNTGWGYICGNPTWTKTSAHIACHQLGMKYLQFHRDGSKYGTDVGSDGYRITSITCEDVKNTLLDCTETIGTICTGIATPAAIDCTPEYSETFSCYNGGTPTVGEEGSGDTSADYKLFIYCVCPPEYTGDMCEKDLVPVCMHGGTATRQPDETYKCTCLAQYTGTYCEQDVDECVESLNDCNENASCLDNHGGFSCTCNTGYSGTGHGASGCSDVDECTTNTHNCADEADCANTPGSFSCTCRTGYDGDGYQCADIDECSGSNNCNSNARCFNTYGSYYCSCNTGYSGGGLDPNGCSDVDECTTNKHNCADEADCANTAGSFSCTCKTGFNGDGYQCSDVNECSRSNDCNTNAACLNTYGSFTCECNKGYSGGGTGSDGCTDVDECTTNTHNCADEADCANTAGSFSCTCKTGYNGDGYQCSDIDECSTTNDCNSLASCTNTYGSFTCACNKGYSGNGIGNDGCSDVDECTTDTHNCADEADCANTAGSFSCSCKTGYNGDGYQCSDINECSGSNDCNSKASCMNTYGSYLCTCYRGYNGTGRGADGCSDVDECTTDTHNCADEADCANIAGSFSCTCKTGFNGDGYQCSDINECSGSNDCNSDATCFNTYGSYTCSCNSGYNGGGTGNGGCSDVDECTTNTHNCADEADCANTAGSFSCTCKTGYNGDGYQCTDTDECASPNDCDPNAECFNTYGSYYCKCNSGYSGDGTSCDDIDECSTAQHNCDTYADCANTAGSFTCSCKNGYEGDGVQCQPQESDGSSRSSRCMNGGTFRSFSRRCTCPPDFTGSSCETDLKPVCHNNGSIALKEAGVYFCKCKAQFTGKYCESDVNRCQNGGNTTYNDGAWNCTCPAQFTGTNCETDLRPVCHNGGTAVEDAGTWSCSCTVRFSGPYCETDLSPVCHNGGTAVENSGTWTCSCTAQFTGTYCENDLQPVCHNGGTAQESEGTWSCSCTNRFTGTYCEADLQLVCHNGGTVQESGGTWSCSCTNRFTGTYCEADLSPVCHNSGTAVENSGTWTCSCTAQFTGTYCETDLRPVCLNGGTAVEDAGTWTCSCTVRFSGPYCETDLQPFCHNGGTAQESSGTWSCSCQPEFTGASCEDVSFETSMAEQPINPCNHGGTPNYDSRRCQCMEFFTGVLCESILLCENNGFPAFNESTKTYYCHCEPGWTGLRCETDINECTVGSALCEHLCNNTLGSYVCSCHGGYKLRNNMVDCEEPDEVQLEVGLDIPWEEDYSDPNTEKGRSIREDLRRDLVRKNPRLSDYDENDVELILSEGSVIVFMILPFINSVSIEDQSALAQAFRELTKQITVNGQPARPTNSAKLVTADGARKVEINHPCFLFVESQYCENGGQCEVDGSGQPYCQCSSGYAGAQCSLKLTFPADNKGWLAWSSVLTILILAMIGLIGFYMWFYLRKQRKVHAMTSELEELLTQSVSKDRVVFNGRVINKSEMKDIDRLEPIGQILDEKDPKSPDSDDEDGKKRTLMMRHKSTSSTSLLMGEGQENVDYTVPRPGDHVGQTEMCVQTDPELTGDEYMLPPPTLHPSRRHPPGDTPRRRPQTLIVRPPPATFHTLSVQTVGDAPPTDGVLPPPKRPLGQVLHTDVMPESRTVIGAHAMEAQGEGIAGVIPEVPETAHPAAGSRDTNRNQNVTAPPHTIQSDAFISATELQHTEESDTGKIGANISTDHLLVAKIPSEGLKHDRPVNKNLIDLTNNETQASDRAPLTAQLSGNKFASTLDSRITVSLREPVQSQAVKLPPIATNPSLVSAPLHALETSATGSTISGATTSHPSVFNASTTPSGKSSALTSGATSSAASNNSPSVFNTSGLSNRDTVSTGGIALSRASFEPGSVATVVPGATGSNVNAVPGDNCSGGGAGLDVSDVSSAEPTVPRSSVGDSAQNGSDISSSIPSWERRSPSRRTRLVRQTEPQETSSYSTQTDRKQ